MTGVDDGGVGTEGRAQWVNLLKKLYVMFVVEAKARKQACRFNPEHDNLDSASGGFLITDNDDKSLFKVISGQGVSNSLDKGLITYPMMQAMITIAIGLREVPDLQPAPLGMSVVCNLADAEKGHWRIHDHGGLHFVANYARSFRSNPNNRANAHRMPSMVYCLGISLGMDQANKARPGEYDTVRSFLQSTGLTDQEVKALKLNAADWSMNETAGATARRAKALANELKSIFNSMVVSPASSESGEEPYEV